MSRRLESKQPPCPTCRKLTRRAAEEIARREAASSAARSNSSRTIPPDPPIRPHYLFSDAAGVPEDWQIECHGVRVPYATRERILERLGPCLLDFDGERFIFIKRGAAGEAYKWTTSRRGTSSGQRSGRRL